MSDSDELAVLVAAVAGGDRAAFARLFDHYAPRIAAYLMQRGVSAENAEEMTQEAMVALWRKAGTFEPSRGTVTAWVFAIARHLRVDRERQRSSASLDLAFDPFEPREPVRAPDDALHALQVDRRVRAALERLPPAQSRAIHLFYFAERPHPRIARDLAIPLGTVKSQIRQAIERLRRLLEVDDPTRPCDP